MYEKLFEHLSKYSHLEPEEKRILLSHLQLRELPRKEFLLKEGQVCFGMYFVIKGCLRLYATTEKGSEQILQFGIENWWISDYLSFENKLPSHYYIQAVEDSQVAVINRDVYEPLFHQLPGLERYFRLMMQRAYTASLKKIEILLCQSAEERYQEFTNTFPAFAGRIPQYMLASFLGFTPEFLSMLRAKSK